jgi:hypothetical protein
VNVNIHRMVASPGFLVGWILFGAVQAQLFTMDSTARLHGARLDVMWFNVTMPSYYLLDGRGGYILHVFISGFAWAFAVAWIWIRTQEWNGARRL